MAEREAFFKYLDWIYCWFCEKQCSPEVDFYYLQCGGICCVRCINKMHEPKPENRINCNHCNKLVGSIRISPNMPEKFRCLFQNPEMHLNKYFHDLNYQSKIRQDFLDYMESKIENATKYGNKLRRDSILLKKNVDEIVTKRNQLIDRIRSVIPAERIEQILETMTLEEIKNTPYEQMVAGQPRPRRRDSVHYPSKRSRSNSTSSHSQSRSSSNRSGPSSSSLQNDFNNLKLSNHYPRQAISADRRRQSHDVRHYSAAETLRASNQHQQTPAAAVGRHRQHSRDHYRTLDVAAVVPARRRDSRNTNVSNVLDPNARMAFHR